MELKRVVITGLGALTPIGNNLAEYWDSLKNGRSGAAPIRSFDASKFKTTFACELKGFDGTAIGMNHIAIFASGNGSNAQALIEYFAKRTTARIELLVSNKPKAYALERAKKHDIATVLISHETPCSELLQVLHTHRIDWIILAGYLALVPAELISEFPSRIARLHNVW